MLALTKKNLYFIYYLLIFLFFLFFVISPSYRSAVWGPPSWRSAVWGVNWGVVLGHPLLTGVNFGMLLP